MFHNPNDAEVINIASSIRSPAKLYTQAWIHVLDKDLSFKVLKVLSLDIVRDYDKAISDNITLTVAMTPGTWSDGIYPYIDNLEVTVLRALDWSGLNQTTSRYKAYVKNPINYRKQSSHLQGLSTEALDRMDIIKIEIQLVSLLIEKLLPIQTGTIFNNAKMEDALQCMLFNESTKIEGLDSHEQLQGVDMVPADNQQVYLNIPVPHATKLVNLPHFMQKSSFGIYKDGIGHYIQNAIWYVYPKFRTQRQDHLVRYVHVFASHRDLLKFADSTYRVEGEDIFIIGSLESESNDNIRGKLMNYGSGIRSVNKIAQGTDEALTVSDNKAIIKRQQSISEFTIKQDNKGVDYAPLSLTQQDVNLYEQVSNIEGHLGKLYALVWQRSDPDLIKPGSLVKFYYSDENNHQVVLNGVILKAHHYIQAASTGMTSSSYDCTTGLFIYCR